MCVHFSLSLSLSLSFSLSLSPPPSLSLVLTHTNNSYHCSLYPLLQPQIREDAKQAEFDQLASTWDFNTHLDVEETVRMYVYVSLSPSFSTL